MSLQAHYKLDDNAASTVVADASGNGYPGTAARNTDQTSAVGKVGLGYNANGTSDAVTVARFAPTGAVTYAAWLKPTALGSYRGILSQRGNAAGDFVLRSGVTAGSGTLTFLRWTGVENALQTWASVRTLVTGSWQHIVVVYDGSATLVVYINGVPESITATTANVTLTAESFFIGFQGTTWFSGILDDVRVYNEALTAQQVAAVYNGGRGSPRPVPWQRRLVQPTIRQLIRGAA